MKIQIISDLHLEFQLNRDWLMANPIVPRGEVLLIAGDLGNSQIAFTVEMFLNDLAKKFPMIISTWGNHDYYTGGIDNFYPSVFKALTPNNLILNNKSYVHNNVKFIVSTLWSKVSAERMNTIERKISDYHQIRSSNPYHIYVNADETNSLYDLSVKYILEELNKPFPGKIVLLTHHLPTRRVLNKDFYNSEISEAFYSELSHIIERNHNIKLWAHGHAHDRKSIKIGDCIVARNPLGYVSRNEEDDFRCDFYVEV